MRGEEISPKMVEEIRRLGGKVYLPHLSNFGDFTVGRDCVFHSHVWVGDGVRIGNRVRVQAFTYIPPGVTIGNDVFLGPRVTFTNDKKPPSDTLLPTTVGDRVSIGAGAVILPGVVLGSGCMIGAGAVVTTDVLAGDTVVGNPAKSLGRL